jgi:hypothetical protein
MSIAPELRQTIYEMVFDRNRVYVDTRKQRYSYAHALLLVNKEIYTEATATYYNCSIFLLRPAWASVADWLRALPAARQSQVGNIVCVRATSLGNPTKHWLNNARAWQLIL